MLCHLATSTICNSISPFYNTICITQLRTSLQFQKVGQQSLSWTFFHGLNIYLLQRTTSYQTIRDCYILIYIKLWMFRYFRVVQASLFTYQFSTSPQNPSQHMVMVFPNYFCSEMCISSVAKRNDQLVMIKQMTSKSVIFSRIFAVAHFL